MSAVVVDTNVAIVANGNAEQASLGCVRTCISALIEVVRDKVVVADLGLRIFSEYRAHLSPSGQPGVGDAFFKHVWLNQANPRHCELVALHCRGEDNDDFEEFPNDPALAKFDRSDRKFVAVVRASQHDPVILNATDTDWRDYRDCLRRHGVFVTFLCPNAMRHRR